MNFKKLSLILFACVFCVGTVKAGPGTGSHGGNSFGDKLLTARQVAYSRVMNVPIRVLEPYFPHFVEKGMDPKIELARDILESPLDPEGLKQQKCAVTDPRSRAKITFSETVCNGEFVLFVDQFATIFIHESAHHLGIEKEALANAVAFTVNSISDEYLAQFPLNSTLSGGENGLVHAALGAYPAFQELARKCGPNGIKVGYFDVNQRPGARDSDRLYAIAAKGESDQKGCGILTIQSQHREGDVSNRWWDVDIIAKNDFKVDSAPLRLELYKHPVKEVSDSVVRIVQALLVLAKTSDAVGDFITNGNVLFDSVTMTTRRFNAMFPSKANINRVFVDVLEPFGFEAGEVEQTTYTIPLGRCYRRLSSSCTAKVASLVIDETKRTGEGPKYAAHVTKHYLF